jgi:formamidopyrimidine-DNA glycosylase
MAELPEIETLRHDLEREVAGKRIKSVEFAGMKCLSRHQNRKQVISQLEGAKISGVRRRGVLLIFKLDNDQLFVVDASAGGHLRKHTPKDAEEPHTQAVIAFTQGGQLRVVDPADGDLQMFVVAADELEQEVPALAAEGPDPVTQPMSWLAFAEILRHSEQKLKVLLMDPTVVAGVGTMYSDEILWDAGVKADRVASGLSTQEERRLHRSVVEIMHDAIKHRGTSLGDDGFVDLAGKPGGYQVYLNAFERAGEACKRCRSVIIKRKVSGRVNFACGECQV